MEGLGPITTAETTTYNPNPIKARIVFKLLAVTKGIEPLSRVMTEEIVLDRFWLGWECLGIEFLPKEQV